MEEIGNISPDSSSAGKNPISKETWLAKNWFLKIVDQWYISYFGDTPDSPEYRSDALDSYYRITKQTNEYIRKQKHCI